MFSVSALADVKTLPSNISGRSQAVSYLGPEVQVTLILNSATPISAAVAPAGFVHAASTFVLWPLLIDPGH